MNNFMIYSIEIAISLALFYTAYWVFLKNETFFKLNRFYLVFSVLISLLTPMLNIQVGQNSFLTKLVLPINQYEQNIIGNDQIKNEMQGSENGTATLSNDGTSVNAANSIHPNHEHMGSSSLFEGNEQEQKTNWLTILSVIYVCGVAFFLIRFVANFIWIFSYVFKNKPRDIFGMKVITIDKNLSPFSFLNFIFISNKEYPEAELVKIISHEKVHIQQKHSIDLILVELFLAFQWFNPFIWFHKKAIKITHEYLADLGTLNSGIDLPDYQYSLLHQAVSNHNIEMTSPYNLSIKRRIEMMMKTRSTKLSALKLGIALPILIFLLSAFAFNTDLVAKEVEALRFFNEDTSIKKVDVPAEYLKLLQGEYVSTNDIYIRKIVFTELLGTLFGNDAGYTYRIIPVGGENFINPDDKASLIFNSKDKNAVSLLLFGKINLNKVKTVKGSGLAQQRSMAFTLANVMLKDGIPAAIAYHKIAKDSSNYFNTEREMSYAGYYLLQGDKVKEATALLKLDTELFPNSFNAFDSYAEALLIAKDKTLAIENFKKSVQLNPGSQNGLKRLKELGINPDDVVKPVKISNEELKLLEGVYLSTDQPNWIRKITITVENSLLTGEDNGYHYKLIHMGNGKFINPDDGEPLVFDTKDKTAINLLLFGAINLKKIKPSKEPALNLQEYVGRYVPDNKDTMLRTIEVINEGNKLFRISGKDPKAPGGTLELKFVTDNLFYYPDNTGRSMEFMLNDKKQVTGILLRRYEATYKLYKEK
jgi:tetratricopeptide (TPR) repeat protein